MATCKDCLHYDVCAVKRKMNTIKVYINGKSVTTDFIESVVEKRCKHFKDKSRFIVLPCKVGDTIYRCGYPSKKVYEWEIEHVKLYLDEIVFVDDSDNEFTAEDIGKTVFLTREEAEKALKERERE